MSAVEKLGEIGSIMKDLNEEVPDPHGQFMSFTQSALKDGALTLKEKELISIALSISKQCEWCITYHTKAALESGASEKEILEAGYVSVLMSGSPALMHMILLRRALKEFKKD